MDYFEYVWMFLADFQNVFAAASRVADTDPSPEAIITGSVAAGGASLAWIDRIIDGR